MIDADECGCLRHAVALHDGEAEPPPERLRLCRQRRAADDEGPTTPTKLAMHIAETPPTFERRPMNDPFPTPICFYLAFDGREISEQVAMCEHDTLRLGRCA